MFCRLAQWRVSSALSDGRVLPASVQRHVRGCPRCTDFYSRSLLLEARLQAQQPTEALRPVRGASAWAIAGWSMAAAAVVLACLLAYGRMFVSKGPWPSPSSPLVAQAGLEVPSALLSPVHVAAQDAIPILLPDGFPTTAEDLLEDLQSAARAAMSYLPQAPGDTAETSSEG